MGILSRELIDRNLEVKETRIGIQRKTLGKVIDEIFDFAKDFKDENGRKPKIGELRRFASDALVELGAEKEAYIPRSSTTKKGEKIEIKDSVASKALIEELFEGKEDLYK